MFPGKQKQKHRPSLQRRFIIRVLLPPFVTLLVLSLLGFWQLNNLVRQQAISDLDRAASTTAAKLEREFALRSTVLKSTGEELFTLKNDYQSKRKMLNTSRASCRSYVEAHSTFLGAPNDVCKPFTAGFALNGAYAQAIESQYVAQGEALINDQNQRINGRLETFKQFFPETMALLVLDDGKKVVSSAFSGALKGREKTFLDDVEAAKSGIIQGKRVDVGEFRLVIFAFPIKGGSVLAAYDLDNDKFIRQTWESAPIDKQRALSVVIDAQNNVAYPKLKNGQNFSIAGSKLRRQKSIEFNSNNLTHISVGSEAGSTGWFVLVASPKVTVMAPVRDAQLAGLAIIGTLLVGFLWVGTFFVRRTIQNVNRLLSGTLAFGAGHLNYNITLKHPDEEFARLADTMNKMANRIDEAEHALDAKNKEFISVATHELRAPMAVILGYLSIVKEELGSRVDQTTGSHIDSAFKEAVNLRDLITDMLDVARLEGGALELTIKSLQVHPITQGVTESLGVLAKESKIKLVYKAIDNANVLADEPKLKIVLKNLISNAIKYNKSPGNVVLTHYIKDNNMVFSIADSGLGIPTDQKKHIFEKFFRVHRKDGKNITGTGLGMYITKQYVTSMNGKIWFETKEDKGTNFFFTLPLAKKKQ